MGPGRNIGVVLDPMVCLRLIGYPLLQIESECYHRDSLIFFEVHNA